jgi:hypothetical protein
MTLTTEQLILKAHIGKDGNPVEDSLVMHYFNMDLTTPDKYDHDSLANDAYELCYEIMGVKPRWMNYWSWSIEDLKIEVESLLIRHQEHLDSIEEEKIENKKFHQERIAANSYKPNLAFEGLKDLLI